MPRTPTPPPIAYRDRQSRVWYTGRARSHFATGRRAFGTARCAWLAIKERESAEIGPIKVATERRGFIPPVAGMAAVALGIVLVVADRRRRRT